MTNYLNKYFKKTMDHFKIKGVDLAKELGCEPGYVSNVRVGKVNPPTGRLCELIDTLEKLSPGAKRYFGNLVAGNDTAYFLEAIAQNIEPSELVELMSDEQLSKFMFALAARLGKQAQNKKNAQKDLILIG